MMEKEKKKRDDFSLESFLRELLGFTKNIYSVPSAI